MFPPGAAAIVTGIGPGMGRSIALGFARHGVAVALAARTPDRLADVAAEIRKAGGDPVVVPTDITDPDSCARLVDACVERFGRVDVLVQNAHHEGDWARVADADADSWRSIFEVNFFGALHLVQRVVPVMRTQGDGRIVLVNSGAAVRFPMTMGAYAASKSALATLTRVLAQEVGPDGIRVNGVFLGPVEGENLFRSGRAAAAAAGREFAEWVAAKAAELPLGSIPTPDECAGSVLFLASDLARPVTGQHLSVNGGQWCT
jgi:NAD(P)-dependent dehydrogenase (short-subunit alcohol dehydrogenase family)